MNDCEIVLGAGKDLLNGENCKMPYYAVDEWEKLIFESDSRELSKTD